MLKNLTVQKLNGADFLFQVIFQFMTVMTEVSCVRQMAGFKSVPDSDITVIIC